MRAIHLSASFTRPADTTAYAANDAVNNSTSEPVPLEFTSAIPAPGVTGMIRNALLLKTTNTTTNANFRLFLYNAAPTMANDNAAYAPAAADVTGKLLGYIDFAAAVAGTASTHSIGAVKPSDPIVFTLTDRRTLYAALQAIAAYAPGNAEVFTVKFAVLIDH